MVHTIYCETLETSDPPQGRWLDLKWRDNDDEETTAFTRVSIHIQNGVGVLSEVAGIIARYDISIASIKLQNRSTEFVELLMDVEVKDAHQLTMALAGVRASPSVITAERTGTEDDEKL